MILLCIKQHLSNIWSSIHGKIKKRWGWVEKERRLWKKRLSQVKIQKQWILISNEISIFKKSPSPLLLSSPHSK